MEVTISNLYLVKGEDTCSLKVGDYVKINPTQVNDNAEARIHIGNIGQVDSGGPGTLIGVKWRDNLRGEYFRYRLIKVRGK